MSICLGCFDVFTDLHHKIPTVICFSIQSQSCHCLSNIFSSFCFSLQSYYSYLVLIAKAIPLYTRDICLSPPWCGLGYPLQITFSATLCSSSQVLASYLRLNPAAQPECQRRDTKLPYAVQIHKILSMTNDQNGLFYLWTSAQTPGTELPQPRPQLTTPTLAHHINVEI